MFERCSFTDIVTDKIKSWKPEEGFASEKLLDAWVCLHAEHMTIIVQNPTSRVQDVLTWAVREFSESPL